MRIEVELEKLEKLRNDMQRLVDCLVNSGVTRVDDETFDIAVKINSRLFGMCVAAKSVRESMSRRLLSVRR